MNRKIFAALLVVLALATTAAPTLSASRKSRSSLVGTTIAAFPVGQCIYTDGDQQWVGYFDKDRHMTIAQRTLPDGPWRYRVLDEINPWDSHNFITMIRDKSGILYISGNMHAVPLVFFQTDETGDISTITRVKNLVGADEEHVTYPHFMRLKDGRLLYHYRTGGSGNGSEIYDVLRPDGTWERFMDTPLFDGQNLMSAYMSGTVTDPQGNYHLLWVWRDTPDCSTNHDLSHAWSPDMKNWYTASGESLTLPITLDDKRPIVDATQPKGGMINGGQRLCFDAQNRPIICYHKYDAAGNIQLHLARFEDGAWNFACITDWDWRWDFKGNGSIIFELQLGNLRFDKKGNLVVPYSRLDTETGLYNQRQIIVNPTTLKPIKETVWRTKDRRIPSWVDKQQTDYDAPLTIHKGRDANGGNYILRWESMKNNRDKKPADGYCPESELRVVRLRRR